MLTEIDRMLIATPDAQDAARRWKDLLLAEEVSRDAVPALGATRIVLRAGRSDFEFLEPDGAGIVASELQRRGRAHVFAAGAASPDVAAVARTAREAGASVDESNGRILLTVSVENAPIRFVVSPEEAREPAGDLDFLYEATILAADQAAAVDLLTRLFGLDPSGFQTITSEHFGYTGVLTLFEAGRLHRFEVITPTDPTKTMGRFHRREGTCFYMCFAESARMTGIETRVAARGGGMTVDRPQGRGNDDTPDQMWLHPPTLGGLMLGISRPTMAWLWSGFPERVEALQP